MTNRKKSKVRWVPAAIGLGVVALGVWLYTSYTASPPEFDYAAEIRAIEDELAEEDREVAAWSAYTALVNRYERELESQAQSIAGATGVPVDAVTISSAYDEPDPASVASPEGSLALLEWYAASDLHVRLTDALRAPGLRPPSLSADGHPDLTTILDMSLVRARSVCLAESMRMRRAIEHGDHDAAINAAQNAAKLARLPEGQPILITMLIKMACWATMQEQVEHAIGEGLLTPELARGLLPIFREQMATEPGATDAMIRAEALFARSTLAQIYSGQEIEGVTGLGPPRVTWLSHKAMDEKAVAFYDEFRALVEEGPASSRVVEVPWKEDSAVSRARHTPLTLVLPAMDRAARNVFHARSETGAVALHLAIAIYRERTGGPPNAIDDLVGAGLLDGAPRDPYAPDGRYIYAADPGAPGAPGGYTLYSVGPDNTDHGGTGPAWPDSHRDVQEGQDIRYPAGDAATND